MCSGGGMKLQVLYTSVLYGVWLLVQATVVLGKNIWYPFENGAGWNTEHCRGTAVKILQIYDTVGNPNPTVQLVAGYFCR